MLFPNFNEVLRIALLTLGHLALAYWALTLVTPQEGISLMWLPDGYLLACLVILPWRLWPWLLLSVSLAVLTMELYTTARPIAMIVSFMLANLIESVFGALLYKRFCGGIQGLQTFRQLSLFLLLCVVIVPAFSASIGAFTVYSYGLSQDFWKVYRAWHSSAGLGILFVAPLIVETAYRLTLWRSHHIRYVYHLLIACVAIVAVVILASFMNIASSVGNGALVYLSLPLICWSAIKFGLLGAAYSSGVLVVVSVQLTAIGFGPYSSAEISPSYAVFQLQTYLGTAIISAFFIALSIEHYKKVAQQLKVTSLGYQSLFDSSPISLWEEDFSAVRRYLIEKTEQIDGTLSEWLRENPDEVRRCAELVRINRVNRRTLNMFRAETEVELLENLGRVFDDNSLAIFMEELIALYDGKSEFRREAVQKRLNGEAFHTLTAVNLVAGHEYDWNRVIVSVEDISRLKSSEDQLAFLNQHDALTGLPNRLLFIDRLEQGIKNAERNETKLAVVILNIDRFKVINDSHGHDTGDAILIEVAQRLKQVLRDKDTIARIGGDEYILLIEDIDSMEHASLIVDKVVGVFSHRYFLDEMGFRITASLGISLYPIDGEDVDTLIGNADGAMYEAKDEGRNTYRFCHAENTQSAKEYIDIENRLHQALVAQEFYLVYQPQMDLDNHQCIGLEVLIRWQNEEKGLIPPDRFIPIAEQSGLIREIGVWVLEKACIQGKAWLDKGIDFGRMAVNVAGPQLQDGLFVEQVMAILAKHNFPADKLELEITESFFVRRVRHCIPLLERLRSAGIEVSIDDFGTGYSSLSYLKQLPVDKLKIDQSFVKDITEDADDRVIVKTIIAMGDALGMKVIAEGIETTEQASFLSEHACQQGQGYLFSKPMMADKIPGFLASVTNSPR